MAKHGDPGNGETMTTEATPGALGSNCVLGPLVASADKASALLFGLRDSDPGYTVAKELERWRWLKEDATAEQWERASHALDADAEIDAMRRGA